MIDYATQSSDTTIGVLSLPGENIRVVKEVDPGVWLLFLGKAKTFALFNLATAGLVRCMLRNLGSSARLGSLRLHPDFYMGENELLTVIDDTSKELKVIETKLLLCHDSPDAALASDDKGSQKAATVVDQSWKCDYSVVFLAREQTVLHLVQNSNDATLNFLAGSHC